MAAAVIHFLQLEGEVTDYQFYSFGIWENVVVAVGWLLVIGWFVVGISTFPVSLCMFDCKLFLVG